MYILLWCTSSIILINGHSLLRACLTSSGDSELPVLDAYAWQQVRDLAPLSACTLLQTVHLKCSLVEDLAPLASCAHSLADLVCSGSPVASLGPLAVCSRLSSLVCSATRITDLGPLSSCTLLQVGVRVWVLG